MLNTLIALLVEKELLTEAEGETMATKISTATLPADYATAARQVRKFLNDIEQGK